MKKLGFIILLSFVYVFGNTGFASATDEVETEALTWYTDLNDVHEISKSSNKPIFAFFTGSDWCGWCHKLQREVFAKQAFIDWAQKEVVLLELDFPKRKELPAELATQNRNLQQALGVRGYPTIWIFRTDKNEETGGFNLTTLGKLGYPSGAVKGKEEVKFLETANAILAKDPAKAN